jgi:uncharacterized protein YndB with AHSA1/START domain
MTFTALAITAGIALAGLAALPFALPGHARVERSAIVTAAPDAVYAILSSSAGFDRINPFRDRDADLAVTFFGPASGVGAAFAWTGKDGSGTQTIVAAEPDARVVMQLDLGPLGSPVQSFTLTPAPGGTKVTWALDADLGANPVQRVFGLFLDRMLGSTYEAGLANLSRVASNV